MVNLSKMISNFDHPQLCPNCQGYKTMPYTWNSTFAPRMCSCPVNPRYDLAWECPRCKKINAPWKASCDCTPSNINWSPTSESSYIGNTTNKHEM